MIGALVDEFREKELLLRASAISFRVVLAAIPTTLFVIAVVGALQLDELWRREAAPEVRENVSGPLYAVIDDVVTRVLENQNVFWITIGAVLAIAAMASAVDAVTKTLNRIHEAEETRSIVERAANAVLIGTASGLLFVAALAAVRLGPFAFDALFDDGILIDVLSAVVRWSLAAAVLVLVVVLMIRVAPDMERPLRRVSVGAAITVAGWLAASLLFGLYLQHVADYGSLLGNLATVYIALQYVALSAIVYVGGLAIDAIATRDRSGPAPGA
jgi:membrane protein